jgi:hypothetical protein
MTNGEASRRGSIRFGATPNGSISSFFFGSGKWGVPTRTGRRSRATRVEDERHPADDQVANRVPFEELEQVLEVLDRLHATGSRRADPLLPVPHRVVSLILCRNG